MPMYINQDGQKQALIWFSVTPEMEEFYCKEGGYITPATKGSVGIDLCADHDVTVEPGKREKFDSGIRIQPHADDITGFIYSRSGLGAVKGLVIAQGVAVIDRDYTGPLYLYMLNNSEEPITVKRGDRIAQLVFHQIVMPYMFKVQTEDFIKTERGDGGFGSTGK